MSNSMHHHCILRKHFRLQMSSLFLILFTLLVFSLSCDCSECVTRDYGWGSVVCVCNSTHCDHLSNAELPRCGFYNVYTSTRAGQRFHGEAKQMTDFTANDQGRRDRQQCTITGTLKQTILGFGGSFTDATGININKLSPETQRNLIRSYFSDEGIQYSMCRVPIGGSDFSTRFYTYQDDQCAPFSLAPEDLEHKIPLIRMANELSKWPVRLIASPWGAPKWMRKDDGLGALKAKYYQLWADYFIKFFEEYKNNNVTFWGVTAQNEPFFAVYVKYLIPSTANFMPYNIEQLNTFITKYFGPTLKSSAFSNLKIMAFDETIIFLPIFREWFLQPGGSNSTDDYIDGMAFHWYFNTYANYTSTLTDTQMMFPEKFLLSTEACCGVMDKPDVKLGSWERAEDYAFDIIKVLQNWGSGWVDWNMALDTNGGPNWIGNLVDSPIIVNETEDSFYKQPMFYALGHFSKFLLPGSRIIDVTCHCPSDQLNIVAAAVNKDKTNHTVAVVLNRSDWSKSVDLTDTEGNVIMNMNVPPNAIQTYIWKSCN